MRYLGIALALFLCLPSARATTIEFGGNHYWINGVNVPWNCFGTDVGEHDTWGELYDSAWFENLFTQCETNGVNCVRLFIHVDGRSSPEFDGSGNVTGLDPTLLTDLGDILLRAENHNIMVILSLWSYDMCNDWTATAGPYAGMHADLIQNTAKTQSYIDNALIPMVLSLADAPNLFAWEIINEPEWCVAGTMGTVVQTVTRTEMQRFCAMIAEAIHQNCTQMVTLGSASLKWSSAISPAEGNWWSDSALQAAYSSSDGTLDFYQIHFDDWMYEWDYDPFDLAWPESAWGLDKPTLVGRARADDAGDYTQQQQLENAYANGYVGVMFWAFKGEAMDPGWSPNWSTTLAALDAFRDEHPEEVAGTDTPVDPPVNGGGGGDDDDGCAAGAAASGARASTLVVLLLALVAFRVRAAGRRVTRRSRR